MCEATALKPMFPISTEVSQTAHFALRLSSLTSDSQSLCWPVNHSLLNMHDPPGLVYIYISGWIFQKVLAEIVQKDLISNPRILGLFAPTSMRFPSRDSKSKDLSF